MQDTNYIFEKAPIPKAIVSMAIPTIISMLVTMIYNMADTYFVGQTNNALMVSAVSLIAPLFTILTAFGNLFGIGGSTAISRSMGSGQNRREKYVSAFCFYSVIVLGYFFAIGMIIGIDPLLSLLGVQESTYEYAREYVSYIALGCPFILLSSTLGAIIRSEGAAKASMTGNLIGTVLNIILDPIMISGMNMGVTGAAVATVIGNIAAVIYYLVYFIKGKTSLSIRPSDYRVNERIAIEVLSIGIPTAINSLMSSVVMILLDRLVIQYGDAPMAAIGIAIKINTMVIFIVMGLCAGVQPLLAYNYGASNRKRLMGIFKFTAILTVVIGAILTAALLFVREPVVRAFIKDEAVVGYGAKMFSILQISCPFIGLLFLASNTLQAFGKAIPSLILSLCRQGIIYIPFLYLLNNMFGLYGAIYAQPVSDIISIIISMTICIFIMAKMQITKPLQIDTTQDDAC